MAERRLPIYPPDTRCEKCGHPYGEHHYRHPFVTSAQPADPWDRIAALGAEVARLREALEGIRDEVDHIFGSPTPFTSGWLARIRNAARAALGDA